MRVTVISSFMQKETKDFRLFLQNELIRRCESNPSYSLRSFASHLQTNPATLSTILSKKRTLTETAIKNFGIALQLEPSKIQSFIQNRNYKGEVQTYQELTQDTFISISEWYYDAILEMTRLKSFKPDPKWIAKVLDISVNEVSAAVERLIRIELLEIDKNGKWNDLSRFNSNTLDSDFSSAAMRKYQKKILEKSIDALQNLPRTERDHTSMMVCGNSKDLKKAKEMITEFRHKLADFLQREGVKSEEVFQIALSIFPITKTKGFKEKK